MKRIIINFLIGISAICCIMGMLGIIYSAHITESTEQFGRYFIYFFGGGVLTAIFGVAKGSEPQPGSPADIRKKRESEWGDPVTRSMGRHGF